jgi:tRNA threonylcarbamoyladenosine biosynthesis protein TsaE
MPTAETPDPKAAALAERDTLTLSSESPEQTYQLGRQLGQLLAAGDVVGLMGDLGAGKTLFTRGVGDGMGVDPRFRVASPTFTLINEHPGPLRLIHVDLYRLDDLDEMFEIGLFDYLGGDGACLVEWFERLAGEEPRERLELCLEATGDESRRITAGAFGERHARLLSAWVAAAEGADEHKDQSDQREDESDKQEEEAR